MLCLCTVQICFTLTWQPHILRLAVVAAIHTKEHVTLCFVLDNGIYCVHSHQPYMFESTEEEESDIAGDRKDTDILPAETKYAAHL